MAESEAGQTPQDLDCPLCLDVFNQATLLGCGHTFCKKCLREHDSVHSALDHMICPVCREPTPLGSKRVEGLAPNIVAKGLIDDIKMKHQKYNSRDQGTLCVQHKQSKEMFCKDCFIFICIDCLKKDHEGHRVASREGLQTKKEAKINDIQKRCKDKEDEINEQIRALEEDKQTVISCMDNMRMNINAESEKRMKVIKENEKSLLDDVASKEKEYCYKFDIALTSHRLFIEDMTRAMALVTHNQRKSLEGDSLVAHDLVCSDLDNLPKLTIDRETARRVRENAQSARFERADENVLALGRLDLDKSEADVHISDIPSEFSETLESIKANARVKEREEKMGMLEYKVDNVPSLLKVIIKDTNPSVAEGHLPGLPAYIVFMCIRHADYINDDGKVRALLNWTISGIRQTVKIHCEDFEYVSFWLTNTVRLLHTLKQYSGEVAFSDKNTERQNEHCLRNTDLTEYRHKMNDLGVHIYQMLIRIIENEVQPMIVSAMLEGEMAGLASNTPTGARGRNSKRRSQEVNNISMDSLIKQLGTYLSVMNLHGMDPELVKQVLRQTLYLITASTINNILERRDMCHGSRGVQIRYNLSELEEWLRSSRIYDKTMENTLQPLVQVAQLLQVQMKTDEDVATICDACTQLSVTQIIKILKLYTPYESERRTDNAFIRKVQGRLGARDDPNRESQLLIDAKHTFPVTFPYNPSSVELNEITIPESFHVDFLKKL